MGELTADVQVGQSAVSRQLRVLRNLGLDVRERRGRHVVYALHDDHVAALLAEAVSHGERVRLGLAAAPGERATTA